MNKLPPIRRIRQKHNRGCACAAIATIIGVNYDTVMKKAFGNYWIYEPNPSLYTTDIMKIIRYFGFSVKKTNEFNFDKRRAIIVLDLSSRWEPNIFHCIIWDPSFGGRFIDPAWKEPEDRQYYKRMWRKANKETLIVS